MVSLFATPAHAGLLDGFTESPVAKIAGNFLGFFWKTDGGSEVVTDANGNDLTLSRSQCDYLTTQTPEQMNTYVKGLFVEKFPSDYIGTAEVEIVGLEQEDVRMTQNENADKTVAFIDSIVPGAGTGLGNLFGLGGVLGTLFYRRKGKVSDAGLRTALLGVEAKTTTGEIKAEILKRSLVDGTTATIQKVVKDLGAVKSLTGEK